MDKILAFFRDECSGWHPCEVAWMVFCVGAVAGLSVFWGDSALGIVAAATGMMYTVLAGKGKASCYLFGIVNAPMYAWLSWQQKYYGDALLNIYYFAMMFPGFASWSVHRSSNLKLGVERSHLTVRGRLAWVLAMSAATAVLWFFLSAFGGNRPLCDSLTNVLSIAAMLLTVRRCIEQWVMWIAVDAIEVFMWWRVWCSGGNSVSLLLMWLLFLANGIVMLSLWLRDARKS